MTMDGQVKWKTGEEPPSARVGSVLADGLLLATDGNTMLYLIDPDPSGFKPLASAELLEPGTNWAPLALVDGKLLIRDQKQMKCVQVASTEPVAVVRTAASRSSSIMERALPHGRKRCSWHARAKLILLLVALSVAYVFAADWPQYYGPKRDATSTEKGLLRTWPKEGPKVLWTIPVGIGYGGPAVSGGKVYLLDRDDRVGDTLRCLDLATGKELWSFAYAAPARADHPGSRTVPAVDGDRVYTCGLTGDLYCINTTTHKPLWHKNVWKDFGGGALPRWAITQNPFVYGNLLIVASQAPQASVVAYDKLTGEVKWKTAGLAGGVGYVSPSIVKVGGEDHLVMIMAAQGFGRNAGGGGVYGIDPASGKDPVEVHQLAVRHSGSACRRRR